MMTTLLAEFEPPVARGERASCNDRLPDGGEVIGCCEVDVHLRPRRVGRKLPSFDLQRSGERPLLVQWERAPAADASDARFGPKTFLQPLPESGDVLPLVLGKIQIDPHRQKVGGAEPRIDLLQVDHGAEREAGADEKHERRRNLHDDERTADALAALGRTAAIAERRRDPERTAQRRDRAEHQPGRNRDGERIQQHGGVDVDVRCPRRKAGGVRDQEVHTPPGKRDTKGAPQQREQGALGQQLAQQAQPVGAEDRADRNLALTPHQARERQVGDARTDDQEHESGGSEEHEQRRPERARQLFLERRRHHSIAIDRAVNVGIAGLKAGGDDVQVGAGLFDGDARFESAECLHHAHVAPLDERVARAERAGGGRHVDVDVDRILRHRRQDPDHLVWPVVHLKDAANDRRIAAEAALPVGVTQHQHRRRAWTFVRVLKRAAEGGLHAKHVEEVRGDDAGRHAFGLGAAEQDEPHAVELGDARPCSASACDSLRFP